MRSSPVVLWLCALAVALPSRPGEPSPPVPPPRQESSAPGAEARSKDPALDRARSLFAEAGAALRDERYEAARDKTAAAIDLLVAPPGEADPVPRSVFLIELGDQASRLGSLPVAARAFRAALDALSRALGGDHGQVQRARQGLAAAEGALGRLDVAQSLQESILDVFTRTLPADRLELQIARSNLAATLYERGDLDRARTLLESAHEVLSRTRPDDDFLLQFVRGNLGMVLFKKGEHARARELQEKNVEVLSRTAAADDRDLLAAETNLALTIAASGDLDAARRIQKRALERLRRSLPEDHPDVLSLTNDLGSTHFALGDWKEARAAFETVLAARQRTLPDDHPALQSSRENYALVLAELGDLAGARALLERVIETLSRTHGGDHSDVVAAKASLAQLLYALGDLQGARELEEIVLESLSRARSDDDPDLQVARVNLASTLYSLGEFARAGALDEKTVEVLSRTMPENHPRLREARQNLATTRKAQGNVEAARALEEDVVAALERSLPDDHGDLQGARLNLGITLVRLGRFGRAAALFDKVLDLWPRTLPDDHADMQRARYWQAVAIYGRLIESRARAEAGGETRPEGPSDEDRERLGRLLVASCRALRHRSLAAVSDASAREAEERVATSGAALARALSFAGGLGIVSPDPLWQREAFLASESMRAAALAWARLARGARGDAAYAADRARAREAGDRLAALARKGATAGEFASARAELESSERDLVRRAARAGAASPGPPEREFDTLVARLGEGQALVAFRRYAREVAEIRAPPSWTVIDSLCAFVVLPAAPPGSPRREPLARVELGPAAPMEAAVAAWRASLGAASGAAARGASVLEVDGVADSSPSAGEDVRRLVFDPLRDALGGATHVIVAPDDVLNAVPLDALPAGRAWAGDSRANADPDCPLGAVLRIELRHSLLELLATDDPALAGEPALLALGDVSFDGQPVAGREGSLAFAPLPGTRGEVREIGETFGRAFGPAPPRTVLERGEASRENLFALAPKARFLHVATHGWFAPESVRSWDDEGPLDARSGSGGRTSAEERVLGMSPLLLCGLALAGANLPPGPTGRAEGLVTAEELATLDLGRCELAVLSACDTNVGVRRAGQGAASLQRALHMAGARSVVTSLWKVPDEATKDLMTDFYRRLWIEKKDKATALWEAKMRIRGARDERGRPKYAPRDWAAWVLSGDPR